MTSGSLQTVLVCVDSATPASPCPSGQAPAVLDAYILDPSSASYFEAISQPFDYAVASEYWQFAIASVLGFYFFSLGVRYVFNAVRF